MNPYEVLGLNPGASQDEIKSAYRKLIKQYHPDKFIDNPLQDLAEEKMRQINEAYDALTKNGGNNNYTNNSYNNSSTNYNNSNTYSNNYSNNSAYEFQEIRMMIQRRDFFNAESRLNSISNKNAEWHYLYGAVMLNKGWYDSALQHMNTAVNMDPNNFEYRQGLNSIRQRATGFSNPYYRTTSRNNDACDCCINLWCLDTLCECTGGDLIGCC